MHYYWKTRCTALQCNLVPADALNLQFTFGALLTMYCTCSRLQRQHMLNAVYEACSECTLRSGVYQLWSLTPHLMFLKLVCLGQAGGNYLLHRCTYWAHCINCMQSTLHPIYSALFCQASILLLEQNSLAEKHELRLCPLWPRKALFVSYLHPLLLQASFRLWDWSPQPLLLYTLVVECPLDNIEINVEPTELHWAWGG